VVRRSDLDALQRDLDVISTYLHAGKTVIHVLAGERPDADFEPADPDLEDVYFGALFQSGEATVPKAS
jgi:hypothetical protein